MTAAHDVRATPSRRPFEAMACGPMLPRPRFDYVRALAHTRRAAAWIFCAFVLTGGVAQGKSLFVSAGAAPGGDGSDQAPFNSLEAVEKASAPGDEIAVLPSPLSVPPLDGGIALKPGQKLIGRGPSANDPAALNAPRITNSVAARNSGDAVVLADHVEVGNLVIVDSYRGGIYGVNVNDVNIHDNNLSRTNTSCTPGFYVYFPGNKPLLPNGWAAIMVDEDQGAASLSILNNDIHDGICNDGIDIRATGRANVTARVSYNKLLRLAQGPTVRSVLAIGMQTSDAAVLTVESTYNSETYIGSPKADCEGLFTNQTGGSLTWNINHNTFAHGIGGISCNGAEFYTVTGTGPATTNLYISHSTFEDDPGDMIEEDNGGDTGSAMNLTLDDVTIRHTTFEMHLPPESKFITVQHMDNLGRCMDQYSWGHQTVNNLRMINSRFYDCAGDGIGSDVNGGIYKMSSSSEKVERSLDLGDGAGDSLSIDIENSTIEGTQQYALHFTNHVAMSDLSISVENSRLSGAKGPATIAFDQDGSTQHADIDLGSSGANSPGQNCIIGGTNLAAEVTGYDASARSNWWGRPEGPLATEISVTDGKLQSAPVLQSRPPACKEVK
jgi:hypothetical protein